jgi:hypothetical protein
MSRGFFMRLLHFRDRPLGRALWLASALFVLTVQTALPAHQASHAMGDKDVACQYCMLGGHLPGMASVAPPAPVSTARVEAPALPETRLLAASPPDLYHSRAPPAQI